jgi:hypothetical protein
MDKLDVILLENNRMHGPLPLITPLLTSKQTISVSHNKFSGNIEVDPDYLLMLNSADFRLQYVDVSYNLLAGPISPLFGTLHTLRHFDLLSGNGFIGTVHSQAALVGTTLRFWRLQTMPIGRRHGRASNIEKLLSRL